MRGRGRVEVRVARHDASAPAAEEAEEHRGHKIEHAHTHERHTVADAHAWREAAEGGRHHLQQQQRRTVRDLRRHGMVGHPGAACAEHTLPEHVLSHTDDGRRQPACEETLPIYHP